MAKLLYGDALRELREEKRSSLVHVAKLLGCSISYASAVERGKKNPFSLQDTKKLLREYGCLERLDEFTKLAARTRRHVQFSVEGEDEPVVSMLAALARTCDENKLDEETARLIQEILDKKKGKS